MTHPDHFATVDGVISPQPWMQLRRVATTSTASVAKTYDPSGGGAKNEVYQTVTVDWVNNTPLPQWVYGMVHQGGSAVSLQARSRGYLQTNHGFDVGPAPKAPALTEVSRFGGGVDLGMGGLLGTGTDYGIHSVRAHSTTVPLMPQLTGWKAVQPGEKATATVEVRFVSEFWEDTQITGGKSNTESAVLAGELGLDLFAVPQIAPALPRKVPTVVGSATGLQITNNVTVPVPAGTRDGDILVAVVGNQFGSASDITRPDPLWTELHVVDDGLFSVHVKVFVKRAGPAEPASYTFGNIFLAEEIAHLMVLRDAASPGGDIDTTGWAAASTRKKWTKTGTQNHVAPSIAISGQMLICASFYGRTDNPTDNLIGPEPGTQNSPAGMTTSVDRNGLSASMNVAYLTSPPNPTGPRTFTSNPRAFYSNVAVTVSILVPGAQQI